MESADIVDSSNILYKYINKLRQFEVVTEIDGNYNNIGATIIDAILQSGINYKNVVKPRIKKYLKEHSDCTTLTQFEKIIEESSIEELIKWKNGRKPDTIIELVKLLRKNKVDTESDLREWIKTDENVQKIKNISGIKCKTIDYLKILLGKQTNAIDRHLLGFLKMSGINVDSYSNANKIISETARLLNINEAYFDHSIWKYMSEKKYEEEI